MPFHSAGRSCCPTLPLALWSTASFPSIPMWPGTHPKLTDVNSLSRGTITSHISAESPSDIIFSIKMRAGTQSKNRCTGLPFAVPRQALRAHTTANSSHSTILQEDGTAQPPAPITLPLSKTAQATPAPSEDFDPSVYTTRSEDEESSLNRSRCRAAITSLPFPTITLGRWSRTFSEVCQWATIPSTFQSDLTCPNQRCPSQYRCLMTRL